MFLHEPFLMQQVTIIIEETIKKNRIVTHHRCVKLRRQVVTLTALLFFIDYIPRTLKKWHWRGFGVVLLRPHLKHFYRFYFQLLADEES